MVEAPLGVCVLLARNAQYLPRLFNATLCFALTDDAVIVKNANVMSGRVQMCSECLVESNETASEQRHSASLDAAASRAHPPVRQVARHDEAAVNALPADAC